MAAGSRALVGALMLCVSLPSDAGHKRSYSAKQDFRSSHPCPATGHTKGPCPGYVIDHVIPLKRGGQDAAGNMQWQTKEDAKRKDRWE
jgi:hypothetical protein